jgi:hypothetical protein
MLHIYFVVTSFSWFFDFVISYNIWFQVFEHFSNQITPKFGIYICQVFDKFQRIIRFFFLNFIKNWWEVFDQFLKFTKTMVNRLQRRLFGFLRSIGQVYIYQYLFIQMVGEKKTIKKSEYFLQNYFTCIHILWDIVVAQYEERQEIMFEMAPLV